MVLLVLPPLSTVMPRYKSISSIDNSVDNPITALPKSAPTNALGFGTTPA